MRCSPLPLLALILILPSLAACGDRARSEPTAAAGEAARTAAAVTAAETPAEGEEAGTMDSPETGALPPAAAPLLPDPAGAPSLEYLTLPSAHAVSGYITLIGGQAEEPLGAGMAGTLLVRLARVSAIGDFDGDGFLDLAVVLVSMPGGSGVFYDLHVVLNGVERPEPLEPVFLGDRIELRSVTADSDGSINVSYLDRAPGEPMTAPPTVPYTRTFVVRGDQVVESGLPPPTWGPPEEEATATP